MDPTAPLQDDKSIVALEARSADKVHNDVLKRVSEFAYGKDFPEAILLLTD